MTVTISKLGEVVQAHRSQVTEENLHKARDGNLGFIERPAARSALGTNDAEVQRTAANADKMVHGKAFNGNMDKSMQFLGELKGTKAGEKDFNQMAESGALEKLAIMKQNDPAGYQKFVNSDKDPATLNREMQAYNDAKNRPAVVTAKNDAPKPPAKPVETKPAETARSPQNPAPKKEELAAAEPQPNEPFVDTQKPKAPAPDGGGQVSPKLPGGLDKKDVASDPPSVSPSPHNDALEIIRTEGLKIAEEMGIDPNKFQKNFAAFKEKLDEIMQDPKQITNIASNGPGDMLQGLMGDMGLKHGNILNLDGNGSPVAGATPGINPGSPLTSMQNIQSFNMDGPG